MRNNNYIKNIYSAFRERGFIYLYKKIRKKNFFWIFNRFRLLMVYAMFALPVVLVVRGIRPIFLIRFGRYRSDRIGHLAPDIGILLSEQLQSTSSNSIDLFYIYGKPSNLQFVKMVKRFSYVRFWVEYLYYMNSIIPGGNVHDIDNNETQRLRSSRGYLYEENDILQSSFSFNSEEQREVEKWLQNIGWKHGDKFVCLSIRDSAYMKSIDSSSDYSYHNYRDSNIKTYLAAAEALAARGYWVFRMGKVVSNKMDSDNPMIVDYANRNDRSDLLDVWLSANCFFFISSSSGLDAIPSVFKRPVVFVNALTMQHFRSWTKCIWVPKHLFWKSNGKKLTLSEHLSHNYMQTLEYFNAGIQIVDLSSEEILAPILEMEQKLTGVWREYEKYDYNQMRVLDILKKCPEYKYNHNYMHHDACIGADFIESNLEWLQ